MSDLTKRSRPASNEATSKNTGRRSVDQSTEELRDRAAMTRHVVRAVVTLRNGNVRVQHYASLDAAEKALARARARGCSCVLSLCRVVPVELIDVADLDGIGGECR